MSDIRRETFRRCSRLSQTWSLRIITLQLTLMTLTVCRSSNDSKRNRSRKVRVVVVVVVAAGVVVVVAAAGVVVVVVVVIIISRKQ